MEKIVNEGKNFEETLAALISDNKLTKEDIIFTSEEIKGKLFKAGSVIVTAYKKKDIYESIKEYLKIIINNLGLDVSFEIKNKDDRTTIKMYSENNPILIGKNGQTIQALETLAKQKIFNETGIMFKVTLDVEDYKDKKEKRIERLAKNTAIDVVKTKIPVTLENMTSYERRIVHNTLTNFKGIKTHSEGEEPFRHVVIEPEK